MTGEFETTMGKRRILKILMVFAIAILSIAGHLRGVEGAISGGNRTGEVRTLTESEAEEVRAIWRAIGGQEIVTWDGKEWMAKTQNQKREVIKKVCEAWEKAGYQKIKSIEYFVEDIDKYFRYFGQKNFEEEMKAKVGLMLSLSAFFQGLKR